MKHGSPLDPRSLGRKVKFVNGAVAKVEILVGVGSLTKIAGGHNVDGAVERTEDERSGVEEAVSVRDLGGGEDYHIVEGERRVRSGNKLDGGGL